MRQILSTFKNNIALRIATAALFISASAFTANAVPLGPVISSLTPTSGPNDSVVVIRGENFTGASQVLFKFTPSSFTVDSDTQITAVAPAQSVMGAADVLVFTPEGMSTAAYFTYAEPLPVETKKPTLTVTTPSANIKTLTQTSNTIKVSGKASDSSGIKGVKLFINPFTADDAILVPSADGKSVSWTANLNPTASGPVAFYIVAEDIHGNTTTVERSFDFVRRYAMEITRNVPQAVITTPDVAGRITISGPRGTYSTLAPAKAATQTASVTADTRITLTATALPGYIFNSWTIPNSEQLNISESLSSRVITFTAPAENFSGIKATFIPNPFLGLGTRPTLVGLLTPSEDAEIANSNYGFVQANLVTASGTFTGHVLHDGKKTSFTGQVNGDNSVWFKGPEGQSPELALSGDRVLTASFSLGTLNVEVLDQTVFPTSDEAPNGLPAKTVTMSGVAKAASSTTDESLLTSAKQGLYTVALPSQTSQLQELAPTAYPQGAGIGSLKLSTKGIASFALRLADGSITTVSTRLINDSTSVPFYVQTRTPGSSKLNGGSLSGEFTLDPENAEVLESEGLIWFRPEVTQVSGNTVPAKATQIYTQGWEEGIIVGLIGAQYDTTQTAEEGLDLDSPVLDLSGGKLVEDLSINTFTIVGNKVEKEEKKDKSYNLSFSQSTGTVTGSFQATPGKAKTINGIQITKGPYAGVWGYFLSNAAGDLDPESGSVRLTGQAQD